MASEVESASERLDVGSEQLLRIARLVFEAGRLALGSEQLALGLEQLALGREQLALGSEQLALGPERPVLAFERLAVGWGRLAVAFERLVAEWEPLAVASEPLAEELSEGSRCADEHVPAEQPTAAQNLLHRHPTRPPSDPALIPEHRQADAYEHCAPELASRCLSLADAIQRADRPRSAVCHRDELLQGLVLEPDGVLARSSRV